jgi:hypothetical protein
MHRLRSWIQLRVLFVRGFAEDLRQEWASRRSAWSATGRAVLHKPALLLALPLVHVIAVDDDRRLVTSTALRIAPVSTDAPHAERLARLLAEEHRGTVVMDTASLEAEAG